MMLNRTCAVLVVVILICLNHSSGSKVTKVPRKVPRARPCVDIPEEILEQMFGRLSVGVLNAFHHTLQLAPVERMNMSCPAGRRLTVDRNSRIPVNLLSISPWAYRISNDPTRYPRAIPEAYCLCKGCLLGPHGQENERFRSTPVYMPYVILRRTGTCIGGRHAYTEAYISVPVGCTCVPLTQGRLEAYGRCGSFCDAHRNSCTPCTSACTESEVGQRYGRSFKCQHKRRIHNLRYGYP